MAGAADELNWSSVVTRATWGARAPREKNPISLPVKYVIVHHSAGNAALTEADVTAKVKAIQDFHMDDKDRRWADIGYTYLVGEDGRVYEGRGWHLEGAHTYAYNKKGVGICLLGNFNDRLPNEAALSKLRSLIEYGVRAGHIDKDYILKGHRDVRDTDCPGHKLYAEIQAWKGFSKTM